jgi:hypothetical protein
LIAAAVATVLVVSCRSSPSSLTADRPTMATSSARPVRALVVLDLLMPATELATVRSAIGSALGALDVSDEIGLATLSDAPADPLTVVVPIAPATPAQRRRVTSSITKHQTVSHRPISDALAAAYTLMTDTFDARRSNLIVPIVFGGDQDADPTDDQSQLEGLIGEVHVGSSGANALMVTIRPIEVGVTTVDPALQAIAVASNADATSATISSSPSSRADLAEVLTRALARS